MIRADIVSNFGMLKVCNRFWVTFDWSAEKLFIKACLWLAVNATANTYPKSIKLHGYQILKFLSGALKTSDYFKKYSDYNTGCNVYADFFWQFFY